MPSTEQLLTDLLCLLHSNLLRSTLAVCEAPGDPSSTVAPSGLHVLASVAPRTGGSQSPPRPPSTAPVGAAPPGPRPRSRVAFGPWNLEPLYRRDQCVGWGTVCRNHTDIGHDNTSHHLWGGRAVVKGRRGSNFLDAFANSTSPIPGPSARKDVTSISENA